MESIEEIGARLDRELEERIELTLEHGRRRYRDGYETAIRSLIRALHLDPTKEDFEAWLASVEQWRERGGERCDGEAPPDLETVVRGRFPFAPRVAPAAAERAP